MQKRKTQNGVDALSGLQGVFYFEQTPSSPSILKFQPGSLCGYRIDPQSVVQPIWRRHHG
jgi:hypothetical protein